MEHLTFQEIILIAKYLNLPNNLSINQLLQQIEHKGTMTGSETNIEELPAEITEQWISHLADADLHTVYHSGLTQRQQLLEYSKRLAHQCSPLFQDRDYLDNLNEMKNKLEQLRQEIVLLYSETNLDTPVVVDQLGIDERSNEIQNIEIKLIAAVEPLQNCFVDLAEKGQVYALQYIYNRFFKGLDLYITELQNNLFANTLQQAYWAALEAQQVYTAKWIGYKINYLLGLSTGGLKYFARGLKKVRGVIHKYYPETKYSGLILAAMNGELPVVQKYHRLHSTQTDIFRQVMNVAAMHGRLRVVAFIHENRREGCVAEAISFAEANDFQEIVDYLQNTQGLSRRDC